MLFHAVVIEMFELHVSTKCLASFSGFGSAIIMQMRAKEAGTQLDVPQDPSQGTIGGLLHRQPLIHQGRPNVPGSKLKFDPSVTLKLKSPA